MNRRFTVYTRETECQDCYKCLRQCPVKAIRVSHGHASVEPERCIACGRCVSVCPAQAKKIRNDLSRARYLLEDGAAVYACLAPSWRAEFPGLDSSAVIAMLRRLGFSGVVEAALGAQEVTAWTGEFIRAQGGGLWLSSACPACVEYIRGYLPEFADCITPVASPAIVSASLLRQALLEGGAQARVIFLGPCIAKKNEAEDSGGLIDLALTFQELREWLTVEGIAPQTGAPTAEMAFFPRPAEEGKLYPAEGGMVETLRPYFPDGAVRMLGVAGIEKLERLLTSVGEVAPGQVVFIECLACEGGCLGGPGMEKGRATLPALLDLYADSPVARQRPVQGAVGKRYYPRVRGAGAVDEQRLREVMARFGKESPADELNCGGCGYDTCREFARAVLEERAEPQMCVSYMRRLAQNKANALLRSMPSGVVIVNGEMEIIECNAPFARLFGEDTQTAYAACPGLTGARVECIVPFGSLFRAALRTGQDIARDHVEHNGRLFKINIFSIEAGHTVGAVIQDVTRQELKREHIARRAREVIRKNIATVQEIACLLGEHVTDTEILLSSIADDYAPLPPELPGAAGSEAEEGQGGEPDLQ